MRHGLVMLLGLAACSPDAPKPAPEPPPEASAGDPDLEREQDEYVEDVAEFAKTTRQQVRDRMRKGSVPLKEEWEAWEREGPMTPERITAFYKQTTNYIYELGEWHLFVADKRVSDLALVEGMRRAQPANILDFGGGVGLAAFPLARAGFDVTLADLDSTSLDFAAFRAKRRGVRLKFWKSDVEPMPPDRKYDVILALDVLEHLPKDELRGAVDKLIKLKHRGTTIILWAPFGRTAAHPMHLDADQETAQQVQRLHTEFPDD